MQKAGRSIPPPSSPHWSLSDEAQSRPAPQREPYFAGPRDHHGAGGRLWHAADRRERDPRPPARHAERRPGTVRGSAGPPVRPIAPSPQREGVEHAGPIRARPDRETASTVRSFVRRQGEDRSPTPATSSTAKARTALIRSTSSRSSRGTAPSRPSARSARATGSGTPRSIW